MAGILNKAKNAVIGENNDHKNTLNTVSSGEPTIGSSDNHPALVQGPQGASGFHSHPRAQDSAGQYNARGINNNPIGGIGDSRANDTDESHGSHAANKLDPRVDPDRDARAGGITSSNPGYGSRHQPTSTSSHVPALNAGPHSSNIARKADSRVDSNRDESGAHGTTHGGTSSGLLSSSNHAAFDSSKTGPHSSNTVSVLDPAINSDRNRSSSHGMVNGPTAGGPLSSSPDGTSAYGSTNPGHHSSSTANRIDLRTESGRDGSSTQGVHNPHGTTAGHALGVGHNNHNNSAGLHSSKMANELDPRVNPDRDTRAGLGRTSTDNRASSDGRDTHGTHSAHGDRNRSATALGAGPGGLGLGKTAHGTHGTHDSHVGHGTHGNDNTAGRENTTHGTQYPQRYEPLVTSIPGTHNKPPGAPLSQVPVTTKEHRTHNTTPAGAYGTTSNANAHGVDDTHAHGSKLPGPAPNTAGPHKSDMMNKLDPRVDSDLDGSKTIGGGGRM